MKTAEQWWIEGRSKTRSETEVVKLLKQIQIDALREAAEIVDGHQVAVKFTNDFIHNTTCKTIRSAILSRVKEIES